MRFYYMPDVEFDFYSISYTIKSTIDENKDNNFISYFIGKNVKEYDDSMMDLAPLPTLSTRPFFSMEISA